MAAANADGKAAADSGKGAVPAAAPKDAPTDTCKGAGADGSAAAAEFGSNRGAAERVGGGTKSVSAEVTSISGSTSPVGLHRPF